MTIVVIVLCVIVALSLLGLLTLSDNLRFAHIRADGLASLVETLEARLEYASACEADRSVIRAELEGEQKKILKLQSDRAALREAMQHIREITKGVATAG